MFCHLFSLLPIHFYSSYNPNQSNANFNIENKRLAAPASSHRKPLNALRGWEQNLGTGATGDLPFKLEHTSIATMLSTISTVSKIMLMYVQQATSPPNWSTHKHCYHVINDINCIQNHVDVCATGDPPLQIGTHKHCYHVINDINCVQNLMLMYVQQAESPPNEIRSLKICHHPILGLQLMQWLQ